MKRASLPVIAAALTAIATGPALISAAAAQGAQSAPPAQGQQMKQGLSFSDNEIKAFAEAVKEVQNISQEYQPQMQKAETPDQQQAVRKEAEDKMISAIEGKGLSVDQYNQIAAAAQSDPQTAAKVHEHLR